MRTVLVNRVVYCKEFEARIFNGRLPLVSPSFGRPVPLLICKPKPISKSVEQVILLAVYLTAVIGHEVQQRKEELLLSNCLFCHEDHLSKEGVAAVYYRNLT